MAAGVALPYSKASGLVHAALRCVLGGGLRTGRRSSLHGMRVLGLDHGTRRIGLALSDPLGITAQPYDVLPTSPAGTEATLDEIARLVRGLDVMCVVAGLPLDHHGEMGRQARAVLDFVERLRARLPVPVETWDERYSTAAAERALLEGNLRRSRRRELRDKVAAALILQSWLDARR